MTARRRLPSKDEILAWLMENPGQNGKREVGRAFGVKGADRIELKRLLRELKDEGRLEPGRTGRVTGRLPPVAVMEVTGRDIDGELVARPAGWDRDAPPPLAVIAPEAGKPHPGEGERILAKLTAIDDDSPYAYEARVIRILTQAAAEIIGVVERAGPGFALAPVDKKARFEWRVSADDIGDAKPGDLVAARALPGGRSDARRARVIERIGRMDAPATISLIAIHEHGIPTAFSDAALSEAEAASAQDAALGAREDLRGIPLVTIDPEDARDHDDAVFAQADDDPKNPGGWIAWVAIADVSAFVAEGGGLDRDAFERGNSTYFPDRVVPMLPESLSAEACSLREGEDRWCVAVRMVFTATGRKKSHRFVRGLMRSAARLTYEQAQAAADGAPDAKCAALMDRIISPLWDCHRVMMIGRDKREPLAIISQEHRIQLGTDGRVAGVALRKSLTAHRLIEELMVQANVCAAETLERRGIPVIYRIHDTPSRERVDALSQFVEELGLRFARGQALVPTIFNRLLGQAQEGEHAEVLNIAVLRAQAQAIYSTDNIGHFGLNLGRYAHFTSPIRRYADLTVHRGLIRAMRAGDDGLSADAGAQLAKVAEHISMTERRSMAAERDSNDRYLAAFMSERIGAQFPGRISGVTKFGCFVRLDETGADGLVPARELGARFDDWFRHDADVHALVGERSGVIFRLGDAVTVKLVEAAPITGGMRFEIVDAPGLTERARATPARPGRAASRAPSRPRPGGGRPGGAKPGARSPGGARTAAARAKAKARKAKKRGR